MFRHSLFALVGLLLVCASGNGQGLSPQAMRQRQAVAAVQQRFFQQHLLLMHQETIRQHAMKQQAVKQQAIKDHVKHHAISQHAGKQPASKPAATKQAKAPPKNPLAGYSAPKPVNGVFPRSMIVSAPAQRIDAVLITKIHAPDIQAQEWVFVAPRIPELPSQMQVSSALDRAGRPVTDLSAEQRPLMLVQISGTDNGRVSGFKAQAKYQATLMARRLVAVPPGTTPPVVAPLTPAERALYLASTTSIDHQSPVFVRWLKATGLRRRPGERDLDFAYRVSRYLHAKFRYDLVGNESASRVCMLGRGDCGGLSMVFIAALRANGVPARMLAGRHAVSSEHGFIRGKAFTDVGYHCMAGFYAAEAGWVPVDAAGVVGDMTPDGLTWFGAEPGQFLTMHVDTDLVVDSIHFGPQPVTVMQTPWFTAFGQGTYRGMTVSQVWQVQLMP